VAYFSINIRGLFTIVIDNYYRFCAINRLNLKIVNDFLNIVSRICHNFSSIGNRNFAFCCDFSITFVSGNNNVCSIRLYKNGVPAGSKVKSTASGSGRSENVSGSGAVRLDDGDYVELWITNESSTTAITAADYSLTLTEA